MTCVLMFTSYFCELFCTAKELLALILFWSGSGLSNLNVLVYNQCKIFRLPKSELASSSGHIRVEPQNQTTGSSHIQINFGFRSGLHCEMKVQVKSLKCITSILSNRKRNVRLVLGHSSHLLKNPTNREQELKLDQHYNFFKLINHKSSLLRPLLMQHFSALSRSMRQQQRHQMFSKFERI